MQQIASARTPVHVWIVGMLATLWNGYACYEYLMTNMKNVISWNTMSKIGVRFGSALAPCDIEEDIAAVASNRPVFG